MRSILKDTAFSTDRHVFEFIGLSTDVKPTGKINGSKFYEIDTDDTYYYNEETNSWIEPGQGIPNGAPEASDYRASYDINDQFEIESVEGGMSVSVPMSVGEAKTFTLELEGAMDPRSFNAVNEETGDVVAYSQVFEEAGTYAVTGKVNVDGYVLDVKFDIEVAE